MIDTNEAAVQSVAFRFADGACTFSLRDASGIYDIGCGSNKWVQGETTMPGTPPKLTKRVGKTRSKVAASGAWINEQTFQMTWRFIETPHHDTVTCQFEGDQVKVEFLSSIAQLSPSRKENRPALVGKLSS